MSIAVHLRNLWHAALAPKQPPYPEQVENADPEPVPHAVIGHAVPTRPVDHVDIADLKAFAADQRRQEAVQSVEIGERQEEVAAERLQAAAGIAGAVAQHG